MIENCTPMIPLYVHMSSHISHKAQQSKHQPTSQQIATLRQSNLVQIPHVEMMFPAINLHV